MITSTAKHPKCPKCRIGGYTQGAAVDGRPSFKCSRCGHYWTNGRTGGEYRIEGAEREQEPPQ